jgi:N-acetylmuramoyl-L-alanine amidase
MNKKRFWILMIFTFVLLVLTSAPLLADVSHKVKKGDTLYKLSRHYGVAIAGIKSANGLKSDTIYIGQTLRIPTTAKNVSRSGRNYSQDDLYWLSRAVYSEARGEPYLGQVAVAAVVLNRVENSQFPNTIKGVIFQKSAFTAVSDGQIYLTPNATAIKAAREALAGADPSGGALYYWNPAKSTSKWIWTRTIINRIGNHVFGI